MTHSGNALWPIWFPRCQLTEDVRGHRYPDVPDTVAASFNRRFQLTCIVNDKRNIKFNTDSFLVTSCEKLSGLPGLWTRWQPQGFPVTWYAESFADIETLAMPGLFSCLFSRRVAGLCLLECTCANWAAVSRDEHVTQRGSNKSSAPCHHVTTWTRCCVCDTERERKEGGDLKWCVDVWAVPSGTHTESRRRGLITGARQEVCERNLMANSSLWFGGSPSSAGRRTGSSIMCIASEM